MGWGSGNLGGGSGKLFAAISVTYPVGSTLTCTDGQKTLKAKTTTGLWIFAIPYIGTWTVTATDPADPSDTASKTVEITTEGQSVSVELYYTVPAEYQLVEYIQNTSSAFIDPEISPAINFSCQMRIAADAYGDGLFGIYQSLTPGNSTYRVEIYANESQRSWRLSVGTTTTNIQGKDLNSVVLGELVDLTYEQSANSQILTGLGKSVQHSYATIADPYCTFFRYIGGIDYRGKGKLAHSIMHNDFVLVRNMWACYRKSDGVAGMWDRVSKTFFTNAGSGTFVVGPDI